MVNECNREIAQVCRVRAEDARQAALRQARMIWIHVGVLAAGGAALASGLIPLNDITIMLAMALGCGASSTGHNESRFGQKRLFHM